MFGIGLTEGLFVCLVVLLVFGPDKLPEFASKFGKLIGSFRKTSDRYRREFYNSFYQPAEDIKKQVRNEVDSLTKDPIKSAEDSIKQIGADIKQELKEKSSE